MRVFALWPNIFRKNVFVLMEYAILFLNVFSYFMETYVNVSTKGVQASSTKLGSQKTTFILLHAVSRSEVIVVISGWDEISLVGLYKFSGTK